MTWDGDKDRTLLLQILTFHPAQVTSAEWDLIAQKWGNGTKGESFRKRFVKIKSDHAEDEDVSLEGMINIVGKEKEHGLDFICGCL
jgi:hypothetical protein